MGGFYTNITLKGPNEAEVADYLRQVDRTAFVSPTIERVTIVYDKASECQGQRLFDLAHALSRNFD